jgi:hypothetical protein
MPSINSSTNCLTPSKNGTELAKLLQAVLVDMTALKTAIAATNAKLDADGGVTDTNYAATCNAAALTTTA